MKNRADNFLNSILIMVSYYYGIVLDQVLLEFTFLQDLGHSVIFVFFTTNSKA